MFWSRWRKRGAGGKAPAAPPPDKKDGKRPRIEAFGLGASDDFDHFPYFDTSEMVAGSPEQKAVEALKAGTYMPFMRSLPFTSEWSGAPHRSTFSASVDNEFDGAVIPLHGEGSFTWSPKAAAVRAPAQYSVVQPNVQDSGGVTAEAQRIEELERMYGAPQNRIPLRRKYYANPRQYYDHVLFADAYANTFAGEVIDTLVDFVMGNGVYPALVLRNPSGDAEKDSAELEKGQDAIKRLMAIDDWYSDTAAERQDTWFDVPFQAKIKAVVTNMLVFGRCCIVKEYWEHLPKVEDYVDLSRKKDDSGPDEGKDEDPSDGGNGDKKEKRTDTWSAAEDKEEKEDDGGGQADYAKDLEEYGKEDGMEDEEGEDDKPEDDSPIPNVLKVIHPIEMGLTEVELYTGKVAGIWIANDQPYVPMKDMMYFVNGYSSPMIGSATYGYSRLQRCIDHTRMYRRLLAKNLPQFLKTAASGMGAFIMNTTGYSAAVRQSIRQSLTSMYRAGEIAVIDYANTKDFEWKEFKINVDIAALVELEKAMLSSTSTVLGVPHSIVFDSAESRATLIGRIVTFTNTTGESLQTNVGTQLKQQHWLPNLRKTEPKSFLEKYTVEARFRNHTLETKLEKVERLLQETQLNPYKDGYMGEELGIPDYLTKIDTDKREEQKENEMKEMEARICLLYTSPSPRD